MRNIIFVFVVVFLNGFWIYGEPSKNEVVKAQKRVLQVLNDSSSPTSTKKHIVQKYLKKGINEKDLKLPYIEDCVAQDIALEIQNTPLQRRERIIRRTNDRYGLSYENIIRLYPFKKTKSIQ